MLFFIPFISSGRLTQKMKNIDQSVPTKSATRPLEGSELKLFMNIGILIKKIYETVQCWFKG